MQGNEIKNRLKNLPNWSQKGNTLVRLIQFPSYPTELEFVNRLGQEAERMDHHPNMVLYYKKVEVSYSTHSAGGITELDFQAAELVEKILQEISHATSAS